MLSLLLLLSAVLVSAKTRYSPDLKTLCTDEAAEIEFERMQFNELTQCLAKELDTSAFQEELLVGGDQKKLEDVITKVCNHLPNIMECTGKYVSAIGPCMDENQRREKELWRNLRMMNMEFACGEGRNDLVSFIDDGGIACIAVHRSSIIQCVDERFPDLLKQQSDTQLVKVLATITQQNDRCKNLTEVENCINKVLLTCMGPDSLSIIRAYFDSLDVLFTCANTTESTQDELQPSEYGPPNLDNIARMQEDSITVLSDMKYFLENFLDAEKKRNEEEENMDQQLLEAMQEQTSILNKLVNLLEVNNLPTKLRKEKVKKHYD